MALFKFSLFAAALSVCAASDASTSRRLSYKLVAGTYEPTSLITDHAAIDRDQVMIEEAVGTESPQLPLARKFYEEGGHSGSFAELAVAALTKAVKAESLVTGFADGGEVIAGRTEEAADVDATTLKVRYDVSSVQEEWVGCRVGALPNAGSAYLLGCFAEEGNITVYDESTQVSQVLTYTYTARNDNNNARTIQGFSLQAQKKMAECDNCPYKTFKKFNDYYGRPDYADHWIQSAFDRVATTFPRGNADFSTMRSGISEIVQKGTVYMNIWMYVIREMEDAIDDCEKKCIDCNRAAAHAWDEAVAFYAGSLENGNGNGVLLFNLGNKRARNFKTAGPNGGELTGNAKVNEDIFLEFKRGQRFINNEECSSAREVKERIEALMTVPMVQGSIRYAYKRANEDKGREKPLAEGAAFTSAVLPIVHACDAEAAETIYENMKVGPGDSKSFVPDFAAVKKAFESVYNCMDITCEDVGGLYDDVNKGYYPGASPCGGGDDKNKVAIGVGVTIGVLAVLLIGLLFFRRSRATKTPEVNGHDNSGTVDLA